MFLLGPVRTAADRLTARLALVGADPRDDEDLRTRKALLVLARCWGDEDHNRSRSASQWPC